MTVISSTVTIKEPLPQKVHFSQGIISPTQKKLICLFLSSFVYLPIFVHLYIFAYLLTCLVEVLISHFSGLPQGIPYWPGAGATFSPPSPISMAYQRKVTEIRQEPQGTNLIH